jgi:hypothetical protein
LRRFGRIYCLYPQCIFNSSSGSWSDAVVKHVLVVLNCVCGFTLRRPWGCTNSLKPPSMTDIFSSTKRPSNQMLPFLKDTLSYVTEVHVQLSQDGKSVSVSTIPVTVITFPYQSLAIHLFRRNVHTEQGSGSTLTKSVALKFCEIR